MTATIRAGLCSVSLRMLDAEHVAELAARAGLHTIEWGGDVHVPPGDLERAAKVARLTAATGLRSCSYGSYFRAGGDEPFTPALDTASVLGVDRVRVWAGWVSSAAATGPEWTTVVSRLRDAVDEAGERGIRLALEFHANTLSDTAEATLRLLSHVDRAALSSYWQPPVGASGRRAIEGYRALAGRVSALHVFSWWPAQERLALDARSGLWQPLLAEAASSARPPEDALLEFLPGDDPSLLAREAATLRRYLGRPRA
ncbi:sugar phosphate isomerase/epimerase family protein [Microbacterium sp. 179-I 3D2 NHS]|uniref:sugar phosphate isomerase/epimerase family protein n=1 Tax=Microbacterium sp. 179-I 3D2 NHS TaxID=3235178 RepID=UPI0039A23D51